MSAPQTTPTAGPTAASVQNDAIAAELLVALQRAIAVKRARNAKGAAEAANAFGQALEKAVAQCGGASVKADPDDEIVLFNDAPVTSRRHARAIVALVTDFAALGIAQIRFARALSAKELDALLALFGQRVAGADPTQTCRKFVEGLWNTGLRGTVDVVSLEQLGHAAARIVKVDELTRVRLAYARLFSLVSEYFGKAKDDELRRWTAWKLVRAVHALTTLAGKHERELLALAATQRADAFPVNHGVNTCVLAILTGRAIGLPRALLVQLGVSGLLAWQGKLRTDPASVNKAASARSPAEAREFARHPFRALGAILEPRWLDEPILLAALVAFEHDARRGVPPVRKPLGEANPLAQIVALCDIYDGVRAARPNDTPAQALEFVLADKSRFDETLAAVFRWLVLRQGEPQAAARATAVRGSSANEKVAP